MAGKKNRKKGNAHVKTREKEPFWLNHPYIVIFLVAFIVFIRTAGFDFVYVDDDAIILDKYDKISSLSDIPDAITSQYGFKESTPYYRPLINLSFVLDSQIAGKEPGWYHISNIIFHAVAVSLLFLILIKIGIDRLISLFLSIIFMIHPLLNNAVLWIPGRNDLIAGVFCLLAFLYFIKYISNPSNKNIFLHSLFYLLGIFSKEVVMVLPILCLTYLFLFERKNFSKNILIKSASLWIIPIIMSLLLRSIYVHSIGNITYGLPALIENIRIIPEVIYKVFIPFNISVLPTFSNIRTLIGSILLLILLLLPFGIKSINRKRYYFGLLWFFLFLLPGLLVVYANQSEGFDYLDTRDYLPVMGLIFSAGGVLFDFKLKEVSFRKIRLAIGLLILLLVVSFIQGNQYKNAEVFAKSAIENNPDRPFFYQKLADYYFTRKDYKNAVEYMKETIKREPGSFIHYKNLALAYLHLNQRENALKVLEQAVKLNDHDPDVLNGLIRINYELGRYEESFYYVNKAVELGGKVDPGLYQSLKKLVNEQDTNKKQH